MENNRTTRNVIIEHLSGLPDNTVVIDQNGNKIIHLSGATHDNIEYCVISSEKPMNKITGNESDFCGDCGGNFFDSGVCPICKNKHTVRQNIFGGGLIVHSYQFGWHILLTSNMQYYKSPDNYDNRLDFAECWDTKEEAEAFAVEKNIEIY